MIYFSHMKTDETLKDETLSTDTNLQAAQAPEGALSDSASYNRPFYLFLSIVIANPLAKLSYNFFVGYLHLVELPPVIFLVAWCFLLYRFFLSKQKSAYLIIGAGLTLCFFIFLVVLVASFPR